MEEIFKNFETMQKPPQLSPQTQEESMFLALHKSPILLALHLKEGLYNNIADQE